MNAALRRIFLACAVFIFSCAHTPEEMRTKLESLVASDLRDILSQMSERGLDSLIADQPKFTISQFKVFSRDSARVISAYSEVRFYYFKRLKLHQVRKYRFNSATGMWERYEINLKHIFAGDKGIQKKPSDSGNDSTQ